MKITINKIVTIGVILTSFCAVTSYSVGLAKGKEISREESLLSQQSQVASVDKQNNDDANSSNDDSNKGNKASNTNNKSSKNGKSSSMKNKKQGKSTSSKSSPVSSTTYPASVGSIPSKLKDGTYYGSAKGYGGLIKVKVDVSGGKISAVEVVSHTETPEYFQKGKGVISSIISNQSASVDAVSGATLTSRGIMAAVSEALKSAGAGSGSTGTSAIYAGQGQDQEIKKLKDKIAELEKSLEEKEGNISTGKLKDGKYQGKGIGFKGATTTVEVTVTDSKITDIEILSNGDTPSYFVRAKDQITKSIIQKQSPKVDVVSGVTYSSKGIMSAVRNALSKAGGTDSGEEINNNPSPEILKDIENLKSEISNLKNEIESLESAEKGSNATYKDGKYQGKGIGFEGATTTVEVTVKDFKIAGIEILSNGDTPEYFDRAKDKIIKSIIKKQKTRVDVVSGVTYSSNGIMSAVRNALKSAIVNESSNDEEVDKLNEELKKSKETIARLNESIKDLNKKIEKLEKENKKDEKKDDNSIKPDGKNGKFKDGEYGVDALGYYAIFRKHEDQKNKLTMKISDGKIVDLDFYNNDLGDIYKEIATKNVENLKKKITDKNFSYQDDKHIFQELIKDMKENPGKNKKFDQYKDQGYDVVSNATYTTYGLYQGVYEILEKATIY